MFSYMPLKVYLLVSSAMKNKTECFIACYFILLANHKHCTCNLFFLCVLIKKKKLFFVCGNMVLQVHFILKELVRRSIAETQV